MHVVILGSGAVGGYYGARLWKSGVRVTFIARGAHLRAIQERGLLVWSALGDFVARATATDNPADVGPADLVIYAVKSYDNATALPVLRALVGPQTAVLSLQNGVDSVEQVAATVGEAATLGGSTYIATSIGAPGLIEQNGTHRRIVFGEAFGDRKAVSDRVKQIGDMFRAADIESAPVADARVPIWEKFVFLAPIAAFTGAARLPIGPLWRDPHGRAMMIEACQEVERVARAEGVALGPDLRDRIVKYMDALPPTMRSSLLIDLSAGKRIEVEALQGAVVRRAQAAGVPAPIMSALYAVLKPYGAGPERAKA
jgi:2-dehydropantoate 2-reductase